MDSKEQSAEVSQLLVALLEGTKIGTVIKNLESVEGLSDEELALRARLLLGVILVEIEAHREEANKYARVIRNQASAYAHTGAAVALTGVWERLTGREFDLS